MDFPVTDPQREFIESPLKNPAIIGGYGSGKTKAGTARLIILMLVEPGINGGYYMPIYDLLRLRAMPGLEEDLEAIGIPYKTNKSEYNISIEGAGDIYCRSYDNPKRIVSYETAHSIVDELDTLPREKASDVWRKISERNRQPCNHPAGNTIGNVTTPDQGFSGFTYQKWVKNPTEGYGIIRAPTYSNPYLPDGYIQQIRDNYDPVLAEMYIEGLFVSLSQNKVYHFFDRNTHHTDREIQGTDAVLRAGIDFNVGGSCSTISVVEDNAPVVVDEFVSQNTSDFILRLNKYNAQNRKIVVYPDSSGGADSTNASQSDIEMIRSAGFSMDYPKANPAIRDRVNAVNALLSHEGRFKINTNKCPLMTEALESQGYDTKGKPEKFDSHPAIDDWNDQLGYFINRMWPVKKPIIVTNIGMAR